MNNNFFNFLGLTKKSGNVIEGYNKSEDAVKKGYAHLVILCEELADNSKRKFKTYCTKKNISIIEGVSKDDLSAFLGRAEVKIVCIKDKKMSEKLIHLWEKTKM
jgi:ribosomal protein L7Ae-like RNA K-turn-binding protein